MIWVLIASSRDDGVPFDGDINFYDGRDRVLAPPVLHDTYMYVNVMVWNIKVYVVLVINMYMEKIEQVIIITVKYIIRSRASFKSS